MPGSVRKKGTMSRRDQIFMARKSVKKSSEQREAAPAAVVEEEEAQTFAAIIEETDKSEVSVGKEVSWTSSTKTTMRESNESSDKIEIEENKRREEPVPAV